MINIQEILREVADEWDSLEHKDMDTPVGHAIALATEVAQRAVLAEREACARVCEALSVATGRNRENVGSLEGDTGYECADMIRERSNAALPGAAGIRAE